MSRLPDITEGSESHTPLLGRRDSVGGIASRPWAGRSGVQIPVRARGIRFIRYVQTACGVLFSGYRGFSRVQSFRGVKLTAYLRG